MEATRKIAPEAVCTMLCAVFTMKIPRNMSSSVIPGTKPRIPPSRKRIPESIPSVLIIADPLIGLRGHLAPTTSKLTVFHADVPEHLPFRLGIELAFDVPRRAAHEVLSRSVSNLLRQGKINRCGRSFMWRNRKRKRQIRYE